MFPQQRIQPAPVICLRDPKGKNSQSSTPPFQLRPHNGPAADFGPASPIRAITPLLTIRSRNSGAVNPLIIPRIQTIGKPREPDRGLTKRDPDGLRRQESISPPGAKNPHSGEIFRLRKLYVSVFAARRFLLFSVRLHGIISAKRILYGILMAALWAWPMIP